jgi:hypothetical protein
MSGITAQKADAADAYDIRRDILRQGGAEPFYPSSRPSNSVASALMDGVSAANIDLWS